MEKVKKSSKQRVALAGQQISRHCEMKYYGFINAVLYVKQLLYIVVAFCCFMDFFSRGKTLFAILSAIAWIFLAVMIIFTKKALSEYKKYGVVLLHVFWLPWCVADELYAVLFCLGINPLLFGEMYLGAYLLGTYIIIALSIVLGLFVLFEYVCFVLNLIYFKKRKHLFH